MKIIFLSLTTLILLVIIIYSVFFLDLFNSRQAADLNVPNSALYIPGEGNVFLAGEGLLQEGEENFADARAFFEQSLEQAGTPEDEAHVLYKIAFTYTYENPEESIARMKAIAADERYPDQQRAYAVQHLYSIYKHHLNDITLDTVIFSGEPYASFYAEGDLDLAFRKLSEYGISFGVAPYLHADIGKWHSTQMEALDDEAAYEEHKRVAEEQLVILDDFIANQANSRNEKDMLERAIVDRTEIIGNLAIAGLTEHQLEYARAFVKSFDHLTSQHLRGLQTYHFAHFALRQNDDAGFLLVKPHLEELVTNIDSYSSLKETLIMQGQGQVSGKETTVFIAQKYPPFKDMLLRIGGWQDADFAE